MEQMKPFDRTETLVEQAASEMLMKGLEEYEIGMGMYLVKKGSEKESEHIKGGAKPISEHEIEGKKFILFTS